MSDGSLYDLVAERSILVCCGSGGVGKTTVSAAIAVAGAEIGRRTCVVTIDPARRLADALGVDSLSNKATLVPGDWAGQLSALMLDPKGTFDDLIRLHSASNKQAEAILENRIYKNLTGALSGTQEYMAMEKIHELAESGEFDLIVVDTPPTRSALDFLDAPDRLNRFLGNRIFQLLLAPTRAYLRAVSVATQALLRSISKVAGAEIVHDAISFFQAFEGMEEGFRRRAERVGELLHGQETGFILVTSPRDDTTAEAVWFAEHLRSSKLSVEAVVVNRLHPTVGDPTADLVGPPGPEGSDLMLLQQNLERYLAVNLREEKALSSLSGIVGSAPTVRVPLLDFAVNDVEGLKKVAAHLIDAAKN